MVSEKIWHTIECSILSQLLVLLSEKRWNGGMNMTKSNRNSIIDSTKGIAVLMIFVVHCVSSVYPHLGKYFRYGQYGVELFLICSGYTAMLNVNIKNGVANPVSYLVKKAIRIIPIFWLYVFIVWCVNFFPYFHMFAKRSNLIYSSNPDVATLISSLLLFNYLNPKWGYFSLFTCVYSLVNILFVFWILPIHKKKKIITIIIFTLLIGFNSLLPGIQPFFLSIETYYFWQYMIRGICAFLAGILLYEILDSRLLTGFRLNKEIYYILIIGNMFLMLSSCYYSNYWNSSIFIIYSLVFLIFFHGLASSGEKFLSENKFLQFIGRYSWAFYFIHSPVFYWLKECFYGNVLLIVSFICSLMISLFITELYEKPLIKFMHNVFKKVRTYSIKEFMQ